jgi:hypothetical protein
MLDLLEPVRETAPRPADAEALRYVRSYLFMRFCVGLLGIALPFALVLIDRYVFDGHPAPRDSLSAYYYSGVREVFVGTLAAIGVFLVTYKVTERARRMRRAGDPLRRRGNLHRVPGRDQPLVRHP